MAFSSNLSWFKPLVDISGRALLPVHWLAMIPSRLDDWAQSTFFSRSELKTENSRLNQENLVHRAQLQRMGELAAENLRLRLLLNATELLGDSVLVTEVIGVSPSPKNHTLIIDRGASDGVYLGQPILDAQGLMGQVTSVFSGHSTALLITDSSHALPVQVLRNGMRSIAEGTSDYNRMRLRFISPTADIKVDDKLVSSGLGGRFPPGYPVGTVESIRHDSGANFIEVKITPSAEIDRSKHILLVFTSNDGDTNRQIQ
jgi:rod shape-determining protein MreC